MAKKPTSVQKATDVEPRMGGITLPISFFTSADVAPEWGLADRDSFLRVFWKRFGADMLQGVIATVVAKVQTQNWELEGPKTLTARCHRMIRDESDFFRGYDSLVSRGLQDYYTQDNGWFMERLRSGPRDLAGPCLGLAHLDSARMKPTGNNEYPYAYEDVFGKYHLMHRSQYIRIVDLPTPATQLYSDERGFCALSRTLSTAIILTMLAAMKREKLADLPPSALAIFNNISRKQFEQSIRLGAIHDDAKDSMIWRQLLPLFGIDPAHEAKVQFLSLREVWESYDDQTAMDIAAYSFAAGFRIDPREFWPVSQGPLGTGKEAEVQHQKAKAKAHGLLFTQMERQWNASETLPAQVHFKFIVQDIDEEEQRAKIHASQIGNIESMQKAGAQLTPKEVRYLLCKQYKVLPRALLDVPEEGQEQDLTMADVYMDDVERQAKEFGGWYFGPVVTILSDGTLIESDYRSGLLPGRKELVLEAPVYVGEKGGAGSGNWGHTGRPGMVGGSGGKTGTVIVGDIGMDEDAELERIALAAEDIVANISEVDLNVDEVADWLVEWAMDSQSRSGLIFQIAASQEFGIPLSDYAANEATKRGVKLSANFDEERAILRYIHDNNGIRSPITLYRGDPHGGINTLESWTTDKSIAEFYVRRHGGGNVVERTFQPSEILGTYKDGIGLEAAEEVVVMRGVAGAKELTLQILTKDFSCCHSHAAQEFPGLIDNLKELGYISVEESYAADLLPPDDVFAIATSLKEAKQGDDLLMAFTRGLRRQLGLREFSVDEKGHAGLDTINKKIAVMPKPVATQIRKASTNLFDAMSGKERQQAILDIPDEVWEEAERLDLQDAQPEGVD